MSLQNKGLDSFSLNIDFFDNDKIALIEAEHGWKGSLITLKLLCRITRKDFIVVGIKISVCSFAGKPE